MISIETPTFTEDVTELLTDERYRELQSYLTENPKVGDVITGTGGLRKVRWATSGQASAAVCG